MFVQVGLILEYLLGALDVEQDVGEGANSVLVAPHHHVGKAHIVVGGDLTGWHTRVQVLHTTDNTL